MTDIIDIPNDCSCDRLVELLSEPIRLSINSGEWHFDEEDTLEEQVSNVLTTWCFKYKKLEGIILKYEKNYDTICTQIVEKINCVKP